MRPRSSRSRRSGRSAVRRDDNTDLDYHDTLADKAADCSAWPKSAFASCLFFGCGHGVTLTASVAGTPAAAGPRGGTR